MSFQDYLSSDAPPVTARLACNYELLQDEITTEMKLMKVCSFFWGGGGENDKEKTERVCQYIL